MSTLALALFLAGAAAPAASAPSGPGASASSGAPAFPEAVRALAEAAARLERLSLLKEGALDPAAVRRRLEGLNALAAAAKVTLGQPEIEPQRAAHFLVGTAYERFAEELFEGRAPAEARVPRTREAWDEQVQRTGLSALRTASAHLRSCADLPGREGTAAGLNGGAARDQRAADVTVAEQCAARIARLPGPAGGGATPRLKDEGRQLQSVAALRMPELQGCFDSFLTSQPGAVAMEIQARLSLDVQGRVARVRLTPREPGRDGLYECLSEGLGRWVVPGVTDVEIDLPIRIGGRVETKAGGP